MRDLTGHDAMTIHRALGYSPQEGFQRDEDRPLSREYDLVIVDEASMLSLDLADALFRAAGTCHVVLVGDTDQLPPIGPGQVLADLIASERLPVARLDEIFRQAATSRIVQNAHRVNRGLMPELDRPDAELTDFYAIKARGPEDGARLHTTVASTNGSPRLDNEAPSSSRSGFTPWRPARPGSPATPSPR